MRVFVFFHVATMFTAVAFALGPSYLLQRIARMADVPTIRHSFAIGVPLFKMIPVLYMAGAALGILAIFTNGLNPFAPFLLIAYALFIIATVVGITQNGPWFERVIKLLAESPDDAKSPALAAALEDPRMKLVDWFDRFLILAFVFDMIVKPFS